MRIEKGNDYYDMVYNKYDHYSLSVDALHSRYIWLYKRILNKLTKHDNVLEMGCGTGHFAELMLNEGYNYTLGFDFSEVGIGMCRKRCPYGNFLVDSVYEFPFDAFEYDTVVSLEVMEHIEKDIEVLQKIPMGKRILFSVPGYDDQAHVRFFANAEEIEERFSKIFTEFRVETIGKVYIIDATR